MSSPLREKRVRSSGGALLHVEVHGPDDGPTVVLSHGWTCSTRFWEPVLRELPPGLRVVTYDQRGHGRSSVTGPMGYSTTALADDLCAVLEACVPAGSRAVLAGHSMGGMTIMAAADRPVVRERAAAALLASTGASRLMPELLVLPGAGRAARLREFGHRVLLSAPLPLGPVTPLSRALLRYGTMGRGCSPEAADLCARIVQACPPRVRSRWAHVLGTLDVERTARQLDLPTVVLVGTADRLTPPVHSRRLAELLPRGGEPIALPGIGHMTPLEAPDRVAGIIADLVTHHLRDEDPHDPDLGAQRTENAA
ncbi:Pimeloyl-ACP methyl ester carboxylesterase [Marinactinospora thermotolerans DSM 45154]|uniref:Pimeloyl-ACP methyl ester carboxylesterase n=1 Tax=Marinactinospora thermotolerans DSM 45154 TaxID=1122192 RepID=A0A1T4PAV1_9ACTN|nr:alpha/beta hydrolase [Marinactinospora thermotolerans]SJZ88511.1 Pimeloyl-ACP methyl ester carboxylesterase [Marinactinospora thermotolerans DSM 45154]